MNKRLIFAYTLLALLFCHPIFGQRLVFPHLADGLVVADGSRWSTEFDLVNTTSSEQSVKVSFFNQDGSPRTLAFPGFGGPFLDVGESFFSKTFTLRANTMLVLETGGGTDDPVRHTQKAGWALVEGSGGIKAALVFRRQDSSGKIISQAGVLPQEPSTAIDFIPVVPSTFAEFLRNRKFPRLVGFALANPDQIIPASGEIQLVLFSTGEVLERSAFTLPPRGQLAQFVQERFGSIIPEAQYYLRIRVATGAVSAVALSTVGDLISTIPAN